MQWPWVSRRKVRAQLLALQGEIDTLKEIRRENTELRRQLAKATADVRLEDAIDRWIEVYNQGIPDRG